MPVTSRPQSVPKGTVGYFMQSTAPVGWIKANGATIGSASSGATGLAAAGAYALFVMLWNQFGQGVLAIQNSAGAASTRGVNAETDWAANKRLPVFDLRGEFVRGVDDGRGVDGARGLGTAQTGQNQAHTHTISVWSGGASTSGPEAGSTGSSGGAQVVSGYPGTSSSGGGEARPRNVAALACIKL